MLILSLGPFIPLSIRGVVAVKDLAALSSSATSRQAEGTGKQGSSRGQQIQTLSPHKRCLQRPGCRYLLVLGAPRPSFQSLPRPDLKAPFMGLFHTPLGRPRQNCQCWEYFSISRWICLLAPSRASHGSVGAGAQRQVNIRRCRRKAALYCPQDSAGPHTPSEGSSSARRQKYFPHPKATLECLTFGLRPEWSPQVIWGAELAKGFLNSPTQSAFAEHL